MKWYVYVAYFFGGAFLVNAIPHFVSGVTGHPHGDDVVPSIREDLRRRIGVLQG